jgi:hypothetical protein
VADVKITALPPGTATATSLVPVVNGGTTQRVTVQSIVDLATANVPPGTVDTTGNAVGVTQDPALPLDKAVGELLDRGVFNNYGATLTVLTVQSPLWAPGNVGGDGTILANGAAFGELYYGSLISRDATGRATVTGGYQLPVPTEQGYLRADQDPSSGWYFAEPVILSDVEPPTPPGDPQLPTIWAKPVDAANVTASKGLTLAQVQAEIDAKLADLPTGGAVDNAATLAAIRTALNGGVEPPPDITTWTPCPLGGVFPGPQSSTVEAIQLNGVIYFRGSFVMPTLQPTQASQGGFAYLLLPPGFARPSVDTRTIITGRTSPSATAPTIGWAAVRASAAGFISVLCPGCDTVYFDNASVRVV